MGSYKTTSFEKCINTPIIDLRQLRSLSWSGIPKQYRAITWKLLLGYVPTNTARQDTCIRKRREDYRKGLEKYYYVEDEFRTAHDRSILKQVLMDVPRTAPHLSLFSNDRILASIERVLFLWAIRNPASSYVQGINDLVTPFYAVFLADFSDCEDVTNGYDMDNISHDVLFQVEADVYGCLTSLLSGIQDHYTPDQPGIHRMVLKLEKLVNHYDRDLCLHFEKTGLKFLWFAFKWMNCFLMREFSLSGVVRMWDTYFSEEKDGFEEFHVYVCAAVLRKFSGTFKAMEFDSLFEYIQKMPTTEWGDMEVDMLLSQAHVMRLYGENAVHLKKKMRPARKNTDFRISSPEIDIKVSINVMEKLRTYGESLSNFIDETKLPRDETKSLTLSTEISKTPASNILYDLDILMY